MSDPPVNLNKARAEKAQDSRLWTPRDMLADMLADIEAGRVNPKEICVHWFEETPKGGYRHFFCVAGLTYQTHIALLHVALNRVLDMWRGE